MSEQDIEAVNRRHSEFCELHKKWWRKTSELEQLGLNGREMIEDNKARKWVREMKRLADETLALQSELEARDEQDRIDRAHLNEIFEQRQQELKSEWAKTRAA